MLVISDTILRVAMQRRSLGHLRRNMPCIMEANSEHNSIDKHLAMDALT